MRGDQQRTNSAPAIERTKPQDFTPRVCGRTLFRNQAQEHHRTVRIAAIARPRCTRHEIECEKPTDTKIQVLGKAPVMNAAECQFTYGSEPSASEDFGTLNGICTREDCPLVGR